MAPAYDTNAEHTTMAAADVLYEVMTLMVKKGPLSNMVAMSEGGTGPEIEEAEEKKESVQYRIGAMGEKVLEL